MRFLMIAAALSVAALGFTGCAMTGNGCDSCSATFSDASLSDCGCNASAGDCDCGQATPMGQTDACDCGGVGCSTCSQYGRRIGMHNAPTPGDGSFGGGLSQTQMAMPLFARGAACKSGACRPHIVGGGQLASRLRSLGCKDDCGCADCDTVTIEEEEEAGSAGLLAKLKEANAIAMAEQEAAFECETGACGVGKCGRRGCGGPGSCAACARGIAQFYHGQPYGGQVPHTTPPPAANGPTGAGMAPTYAYPYYTTRGPRDFLQSRPYDIGY